MRNGQDVLVYAPRRYGKSSLVLRAAKKAARDKVLVGYCDLMRTPTKERLAASLARTIHEDIDSELGEAAERAASLFRNLREADDGGRHQRHAAFQLPSHPPPHGDRRHDRRPARAARTARRRAQAPGRSHLRRVSGDPRARSQVPEPDAGRLPDAAGGRARLPGQQASSARPDLRRRERAVLEEREADRDRADRPCKVRPLRPQAVRGDGSRHPRRGLAEAPRGHARPPPTARRSWRTSSGSSFQKVALRIAWTWRMPSGKLSAPSTATSARSGMTHRPRNDS